MEWGGKIRWPSNPIQVHFRVSIIRSFDKHANLAGSKRPLACSLNRHPLDFVERRLVAAPIVELIVRVGAWFAMAAVFSSAPPFPR
jgi:hypothetical protein